MKTLKALKAELLASAEVRVAYEEQAEEFEIAHELIAARIRAKMTQAEVAERMGTTQSTVARLEGGRTKPSMRTVERYAEATGHRAAVRLVEYA